MNGSSSSRMNSSCDRKSVPDKKSEKFVLFVYRILAEEGLSVVVIYAGLEINLGTAKL